MSLEPGPEPRQPRLRASDADRERTVERLRQHHADGRLDLDEFSERMERAYEAKTLAELDELMSDLPAETTRPAPPASQTADRGGHARQAFYRHLTSYLSVNALLVGIWAFTGRGYFWPIWPIMGWGIAVAGQAVRALGPGADRPERDDRR